MASQDADTLLQSFLATADETQSQELLSLLICDFAHAVIKHTIRNKLHTTLRGACAYDVEDLEGTIYLRLLTRLENLKTNSRENSIRDFCGYVAVMTTNACNEYLRRKYPQRHSLKNRLRYLLSHDKDLTGHQLVTIVADLLDVKDRQIEIDASQYELRLDANFAGTIEHREYLRYLWNEIIDLPSRQRAALLLNLTAAEGNDVIALFPLTQTASINQIAEAVNIPPDQFASLWRELPLDDAAIAARLGVTRQQVINLRKAARKRLARRGKIFSQR